MYAIKFENGPCEYISCLAVNRGLQKNYDSDILLMLLLYQFDKVFNSMFLVVGSLKGLVVCRLHIDLHILTDEALSQW